VENDGSLFLDELREFYLDSASHANLKPVFKRLEQRIMELQAE